MRKTHYHIKGLARIDREDFDSYNEFIRTIEGRKEYNDWADHKSGAHPDKKDSWISESYNDMKKLLVGGWEKYIQKVNDKIEACKIDYQMPRPKIKTDVVGFAPCVPHVLMGLPLTMYNNRLEEKHSKVIKILYDATYSAHESTEEIINRGVELLARIKGLEMEGYRVRLRVVCSFAEPGYSNWYIMTLPVKNENQPINVGRVIYPLASPSMLRGLGFEWYEKYPDAHKIYGYGSACYHWNASDRKKYVDYLDREFGEVYVDYYANLDGIFKKVRGKGSEKEN